jgi:hypothetical protein
MNRNFSWLRFFMLATVGGKRRLPYLDGSMPVIYAIIFYGSGIAQGSSATCFSSGIATLPEHKHMIHKWDRSRFWIVIRMDLLTFGFH